MMARMGFAGLGGVVIALNAMSACKMCVVGGGSRVFRCKMSLCFPVMRGGLVVMVRGIVVVPCGRM
jgi:hypothetical protein